MKWKLGKRKEKTQNFLKMSAKKNLAKKSLHLEEWLLGI